MLWFDCILLSQILFSIGCIVPVQADSKKDSVCQPMTGYFSSSVSADLESDSAAEASIRNGLLRLLRLGMQEDLYVNGDVRKVSFIGDRNLYEPPPQEETNTSSTGMGAVALSFIILAVVLAFLIAGFLVRHTRKTRREEQAKGIALEDDLHLDADEEVANTGFSGGDEKVINVSGSLAATDELAVQPQPTVFNVPSRASSERNENPSLQSPSTGSMSTESTESDDVAAALALQVFLTNAATPASAPYPEADASNQSTSPRKSPKKKKKRKNSKAPDSPDSLIDESLRTLDSIAEEPTISSIIDETSDDNRSFT